MEEDGFKEYPKCYQTVDVDLNEGILLEDVSVRGFTMMDRRNGNVTADYVRLVMQSLGKFHAISFAVKDQQPNKFKELTSELDELFVRLDNEMLRQYFNVMADAVFKVLSEKDDALLWSKLKNLFKRDAIDIAADCLNVESTEPAAIITHGDMWQNNTMFKQEQNGKPTEVCLLDWQISRHTSPVIDIIYYLFACTTKSIRDAHYDEFLKIYHESVSSHIRKYVRFL